jgi:hypothetical protein
MNALVERGLGIDVFQLSFALLGHALDKLTSLPLDVYSTSSACRLQCEVPTIYISGGS